MAEEAVKVRSTYLTAKEVRYIKGADRQLVQRRSHELVDVYNSPRIVEGVGICFICQANTLEIVEEDILPRGTWARIWWIVTGR